MLEAPSASTWPERTSLVSGSRRSPPWRARRRPRCRRAGCRCSACLLLVARRRRLRGLPRRVRTSRGELDELVDVDRARRLARGGRGGRELERAHAARARVAEALDGVEAAGRAALRSRARRRSGRCRSGPAANRRAGRAGRGTPPATIRGRSRSALRAASSAARPRSRCRRTPGRTRRRRPRRLRRARRRRSSVPTAGPRRGCSSLVIPGPGLPRCAPAPAWGGTSPALPSRFRRSIGRGPESGKRRSEPGQEIEHAQSPDQTGRLRRGARLDPLDRPLATPACSARSSCVSSRSRRRCASLLPSSRRTASSESSWANPVFVMNGDLSPILEIFFVRHDELYGSRLVMSSRLICRVRRL